MRTSAYRAVGWYSLHNREIWLGLFLIGLAMVGKDTSCDYPSD
jgi:hypothetical protein